jgi:hypothetical protein
VSIRFVADADLNQAIVTRVLDREPALDFLTAIEADLEGRGDPDVLEFAASKGPHLGITRYQYHAGALHGQGGKARVLVHQRASVARVPRPHSSGRHGRSPR